MTLAELVKKNREQANLTQADLAGKLGVPELLIACIEQPHQTSEKAVAYFAAAFGLEPEVFTGEKPRQPTSQEIADAREARRAELASQATYPAIRKFILDPARSVDPTKAEKLFAESAFSLTERNVVLYLSTTALYHFCDHNTSSFAFDEYLFKLHNELFKKYEREMLASHLPEEEKQERIAFARGDVFSCERIENIAILVLEDFAGELEQKLQNNIIDFEYDLDMPFTWEIDDTLMKININKPSGELLHDIKLLDVKQKV
ncbi:MAG: hypothetical protein GF398_09185 [Chitinivibrionales bacterium]|nr:hypothetical protein [Chitinivibrionales bacterium]